MILSYENKCVVSFFSVNSFSDGFSADALNVSPHKRAAAVRDEVIFFSILCSFQFIHIGNTERRDENLLSEDSSGILHGNSLTRAGKPARSLYNQTSRQGGLHSANTTPHETDVKV